MIHTREAWADTFDLLDAEASPERTIFHCFTGGPDEARQCLDRGAYVSFSGIVTFPTRDRRTGGGDVVPRIACSSRPTARTSRPCPNRGRRNRPAWVPLVGACRGGAAGRWPDEVRDASHGERGVRPST